MNPRDIPPYSYGGGFVRASEYKSPYERELENAKQYFGDVYPGHEGLTCQKCGAVVNLGWQHIDWHEAAK